MNSKEIREAAKFMDKQFKRQEESDRQYDAKVESESERLEELVSQVKKAQEDGTIKGTLLLSKITRLTRCTPATAEKIQKIIRG